MEKYSRGGLAKNTKMLHFWWPHRLSHAADLLVLPSSTICTLSCINLAVSSS